MKQITSLIIAILFIVQPALAQESRNPADHPVHDRERARPLVIMPPAASADHVANPPSDAIVLFGGGGLSAWETSGGDPAPWVATNQYFQVRPGTGGIQTKEGFGDVQLHVEWSVPDPPRGEDQDRGNSGVFFMGGRYEVQVLDSYMNDTYPDGQAAALYGQYPPLVNAMRPPGEWNEYDIVFRRPRFDGQGNLTSPAIVTVFHNGVLVQDHEELTGATANQNRPAYRAHDDRLPISLQDHDHPVRFRNMWLRELE